MFTVVWTTPLGTLDLLLGLITLILLLKSRELKSYWPLLFLSLWQLVPFLTLLTLRTYRVFSARDAYSIYFYVYWSAFACAAILSVALTYTIFSEALRPLKGLQRLGIIMYRWVVVLTLAVITSVAAQPEADHLARTVRVVSDLHRLSSIVILSLLIFVSFTIRPLGLSLRSRTFGVSLGMTIVATANVLSTGYWVQSQTLFNNYGVWMLAAGCGAQAVWIWYFAVPEPTRKFLLLPTTSPFHHWNVVSERMGYDPGYVAIGGVPPDSLAPAEITVLERIADQNSGKAASLSAASGASSLPAGTAAATMEATERFTRSWDFEST